MRTTRLGGTDLVVSALGFGAAPLGDEYGALDEAEALRAVQHAIDRGITLFDTAPYYGRTLSENRLGRALEGRRHEVVLATKCCRFDRRGFDFGAARVRADVEASLRRLRTDHVDLLQVHDVEFGRREVILEETLPELARVQREGKTRWIGVTGLPLHLLRDLAEAFPVDTVLSYCHYDLLARDLETELLPLVRERGLGLLNASPLHMGVLTAAGPPPWHPAPPEVKALGPVLARIARRHGRELSEVALAFATSHPEIPTTLSGMRSRAEVDANVAAVGRGVPEELQQALDRAVGGLLDRTWHEGLPENAPPALRSR